MTKVQNSIDALDRMKFLAKTYNCLLIGGICGKCKYCYLKQNGPKLINYCRREVVSPQEFSQLVDLIDKDKLIRLDNVSLLVQVELENGEIGSFYSLEFFEHPEYAELLKILNSKTAGFIKNGSISFVPNQENFNLINKDYRFWLAINSLDKVQRTKTLVKESSDKDIDDLKVFFKYFKDQVVVVVLLYSGDLESFKKDLEYLATNINRNTNLLINRLTSTNFAFSKEIIQLSELSQNNYQQAVELAFDVFRGMPNKIETSSMFNPIEKEQIYKDFQIQMKNVFKIIEERKIDLSEVAFIGVPNLKKMYEALYGKLNWIYAENKYFGKQVLPYELLCIDDILESTKASSKKWYVVSNAITGLFSNRDLFGKSIPENFIIAK